MVKLSWDQLLIIIGVGLVYLLLCGLSIRPIVKLIMKHLKLKYEIITSVGRTNLVIFAVVAVLIAAVCGVAPFLGFVWKALFEMNIMGSPVFVVNLNLIIPIMLGYGFGSLLVIAFVFTVKELGARRKAQAELSPLQSP